MFEECFCYSLFFHKVAGFRLATSLKRITLNFLEQLFYRTPGKSCFRIHSLYFSNIAKVFRFSKINKVYVSLMFAEFNLFSKLILKGKCPGASLHKQTILSSTYMEETIYNIQEFFVVFHRPRPYSKS